MAVQNVFGVFVDSWEDLHWAGAGFLNKAKSGVLSFFICCAYNLLSTY